MKLAELFLRTGALVPPEAAELEVTGVTIDSRRAGVKTLFVACPGATARSRDGHDFLSSAADAGAPAVVVAPGRAGEVPAGPVVIEAEERRRLAAELAERLAGSPSEALRVIGITGTNGKTSVSFLLARLLEKLGRKAGVLGTLGSGRPDRVRATGFTTPEAEVLSAELARLLDEGLEDVVMEVSSHALETRRADGIRFAAAGFTNLSQDHLDFHESMEAYLAAKARLFRERLPSSAPAVIPARAEAFDVAALRPPSSPVLTWAVAEEDEPDDGGSPELEGALVRATDLTREEGATAFTLRLPNAGPDSSLAEHRVKTALLGRHNVENLVVTAGLAAALGCPGEAIAEALAEVKGAPGRFERVGHSDPAVIVDYAHTPDALRRVLAACRDEASGRVLIVVGAGGDRDATKRIPMGRAAGQGAEGVWLTNDNPRNEPPGAILATLEEGVCQSGLGPWDGTSGYAIEQDREAAIFAAVAAAAPGDVVLLAGKGHETMMRIGEKDLPFDDREVAARALKAAGHGEAS